ncbi:MAG TPA: PhnD/SsuA/transferrin family substrate-binding protein, partial [Candidatus Poseidoniales archaeon]|nr:PhnD/SsuA/transferrin family substrate-binding protein [Candidatus Poseidoniales archaeon]
MLTSALAGCTGDDDAVDSTSPNTTSTTDANSTGSDALSTSSTSSNCPTTGDALKVAFEVQDDYTNVDENPELLAAYLCEQMGMPVTLYKITSSGAALEALRFGNAHVAFLDGGPAWVGWQMYGLEVLAADLKSDGRMSYDAHAWVRADSEMAAAQLDSDSTTDPFSLLAGKTSCHTGWLKSAGMLMPMGYLIGNGYTNIIGDPDDVDSLRTTITNFFATDASIPDSGTPYYGYGGAVKCLSDGTGDVAFAKHSTVDSYCNNEDATENEAWCLPLDKYAKLDKFGSSPSHMAMYNPNTMDAALRAKVQSALINLGNESYVENHTMGESTYTGCYAMTSNHVDTTSAKNTCGSEILTHIMNNEYGMAATDAPTHLGTYGAALEDIPGIMAYYGNKYSISNTTAPAKRA